MQSHRRDALLAAASLVALVAASLALGSGPSLLRPIAAGTGVTGALAVEVAFLRYPDRALAVWDRPGVAPTGAALVVALALVAVRYAPWLLGAAVWGLATYLVLLACVLSGAGNPVAALVPPKARE